MTSYAKIDKEVLVRHPGNPVLSAKDFPVRMRAVYNSAAIKTHDGRYVMLCRCNQLNHLTLLWGADSPDGLNWKLRPEPFAMPETEEWKAAARSVYFDPRITWLDGEYKVLLATQGDYGCRVALFRSKDLSQLEFVAFINVPDNRNMVIFPEKFRDGRYMRLERPSGSAAKNIWFSFSPDLIHWGDARQILRSPIYNYAYTAMGPSTVPYRTPEGWLVIWHAIMQNCSTIEYSVGAMLLDLDEPWKVKHVTQHPILSPTADYEMQGLVEHVCFPCSMIVEPDQTVKVYYGAADMVQCVAVGKLADIIHACKHW